MTQEETVAAEFKTAAANLVLAMAAVGNSDRAAAEQAVIGTQERSAVR
jgi:DNA-binding PucR family transcriptional regulator